MSMLQFGPYFDLFAGVLDEATLTDSKTFVYPQPPGAQPSRRTVTRGGETVPPDPGSNPPLTGSAPTPLWAIQHGMF